MKGRWAKYLLAGAVVAMLAACSSKPTDRGQQYKDGKFTQPFSLVNQPDAVGAPINAGDFAEQVNQIRSASPRLYGNQSNVYNAIQQWLRAGGDTRSMRQFGADEHLRVVWHALGRQMLAFERFGENVFHAQGDVSQKRPWETPYSRRTLLPASSSNDTADMISFKPGNTNT